jgi:TRAF3-interacting protein 1
MYVKVIKNTGFMKGLYSPEELEGAYIKASKENKIHFLTKLITIIGLVVGEQLSVRVSKITAGVEAEKTNEMLQLLAKAINIKVKKILDHLIN